MSAAQENTVTDAQAQFEDWYVQNAFDYAANPIGSRDCGLMRRAWHAALAATAKQQVGEVHGVALPRLPEAFEAEFSAPGMSLVSVYTAEQMQKYARAALAANQPVCGTCGKVIQPDALTGTTCGCARQPQAGKHDQSAEDRFEQFVQAEFARSPDALRELGEYLGRVLDEDEYPQANSLLLQLATEYAGPRAQDIDLVPAGWTIVRGEGLRIVGPIEGPGGMVLDKPGRSLESRLLHALATALIDGQRDAAPGMSP